LTADSLRATALAIGIVPLSVSISSASIEVVHAVALPPKRDLQVFAPYNGKCILKGLSEELLQSIVEWEAPSAFVMDRPGSSSYVLHHG
jgi:hypothetical protein